MFSIHIDKRHQLLTITARGVFDAHQGELLCQRLEQDLAGMRKGFMVLTDLSSIDSIAKEAVPFIKRCMVLCNARGVARIFRVIPHQAADVGFNIMSSFHYARQVRISTYKTLEEAQYHLILSRDITWTDKVVTSLKILRVNLMALGGSRPFQCGVLLLGFLGLILLRLAFHAFGVSLGYLYITLIALAGVWFEVRGGLLAALIALFIFVVEIQLFPSWAERDVMAKTMLLRAVVYILSGVVIGYLSQLDRLLRVKLERLAGQDELTGMFNHRFALLMLARELDRCQRYKRPLVVALLDLDQLKAINDAHGYLVGNDTLVEFSEIIRKNIRGYDLAARYGEDEFLLIFPGLRTDAAQRVLERIKASIAQVRITSKFLLKTKALGVTFSAGLAECSEHTAVMDDLINCADRALNQAKKGGGDRMVVYRAKKEPPPKVRDEGRPAA